MEEACRWFIARLLAAILLLTAVNAGLDQSHPLRFWIDEYAFSSGETTILRETIKEAGLAKAEVTGESDGTLSSAKGYYRTDQWDVYWTGRQGCMMALPHAVPGHKVSCVPGLHELTLKDRLIARLTQFYGEGAFRIIPRSYLLPSQYWSWRLWLASKERSEDRGEMWVLKKEVHRGKGVHVLPLQTAVSEGRKSEERYDLVQGYVGNQLTVLGRKFYIRLWAVVTSSFPLRAYLYDGGVVVFGNSTPEDKAKMTSDDYIVNLWHLGRSTEARPWSVSEFRTYLDNLTGSRKTYDDLWEEMRRSLGLTFAAGVQSMRFSAAQFPVAAASATFEMVGIDFLVDEHMKPWLLEVNAVPSMARKVINCDKQPEGCQGGGEAESVFDVEKERFVHSLYNLLRATAGVNLTEQARVMAQPNTLADFLTKWKSNATDLALLRESTTENHSEILSQLGWNSKDENPEKQSAPARGLDLENSGRELKSEVPIKTPKCTKCGAKQKRQRPEGHMSVSIRENPEFGLNSSIPVEDIDKADSSRSLQEAVPGPDEMKSGSSDLTPETQPLETLAGGDEPTLHVVSRTQTVGDATNLNKYVEKAEPTLDKETKEEHDRILEEHLLEVSIKEYHVAVDNHFLPLMMIPEAAAYSFEHQSRGHIHPQPLQKTAETSQTETQSVLSNLWLPFKPVIGAYGNLAHMLEKLRVGIVAIAPDVNTDVTIGVARNIPGADRLLLQFYKLFSYGDRRGTVEAFSVLPKHRLDQKLSDYIRESSA